MTIRDLLENLVPMDIVDAQRIRMGARGDGGYVILNDPQLRGCVLYSYGIDDNDSFDQDLHRCFGIPVRQYDFSIPDPPTREGFSFKREGIAHELRANCATFAQHLNENADTGTEYILKLDVEGDEWLTLLHMPESLLNKCRQLIVELHGIAGNDETSPVDLATKITTLRKLSSTFHCWHVHANNYAPVHIVDGFKVPDVLEVTFVNRACYTCSGITAERFPTAMDFPCSTRLSDIELDFWPFFQGTLTAQPLPWLPQKLARLQRSLDKRRWRWKRQ